MTHANLSPEAHKQATAFDHIAADYETVFGANATQVDAIDWLIVRLPQDARVLDVGAGTGHPTAHRLAAANASVTGIDIAGEMVKIARTRVPQAQFHQMDVATADFQATPFHAITAFFSLLMLPKATIEALLPKIYSWLHPQGYFILSMVEGDFDYIEIPFLGQSLHVSGYPAAELQRLLQNAGFTILQAKQVLFTPENNAPPETQLFFYCQRPT